MRYTLIEINGSSKGGRAMRLDGFRASDSRKEGIRTALAKHGYAADDFEWIHAEEPASGEPDQEGTVYVIYRPTGFRRMYEGAAWEAEFEEDLKNQIFKPPA